MSVVEMKVPAVGESITEVTVSGWQKNDGDYVEQDEVLCELESDKATFELTAEQPGKLERVIGEGETVEVGALICKIDTSAQPPSEGKQEEEQEQKQEEAEQKEEPATENKETSQSYAEGSPSPAAKKILDEKGIDPKDVKGTGKEGRITKDDAQKAEKPQPQEQKSQPAEKTEKQSTSQVDTQQASSQSSVPGSRESHRKKMSNLRKTVAKRLVSVKNETAMLTTFNEVDMKPLMDIRKKYKEKFKEKYEVNLGFMSFFTKACTMALKEFPDVNAMVDGDEIVYNDFCDISIAVSTERGLVVPIIRNAENMTFDQIEKKVVELATKAQNNKLSIEEMTGGTFTITNGGIFGSMLSTPIINSPQSAILGMHNIVERPVAINGEVAIRPIMYIALSYDHRIVDGKESVSFLYRIKEYIEDPARLLLGV